MKLLRMTLIVATLALAVSVSAAGAQDGAMDEDQIALIYHKLSGDALDLRRVAESSEAVRRVSNFDRPDAIAAELERLQALFAAADPSREFTTRVNDRISEFDHARGEFSITLFSPGYYVPIQAFGHQYQLVFANAAAVRAIPMEKAEAREFDALLNRNYRNVLTEIRFRVTGQGDPSGGVTGQRVVRAELTSVRVLDQAGNLLHAPSVTPPVAVEVKPIDLARVDVAGFRVGVKAKDLEPTLTRLYGPVMRRAPSQGSFAGVTAVMAVNEMGCASMPGQRRRPEPGDVCITAFLDESDVVRAIRVERLFPSFQAEAFRSALTAKYGPVADARSGSVYSLGWGEEVDPSLVYNRGGPHRALAAYYETDQDFMSRGLNAIPNTRVILQLVDAAWASRATN